MPSYVFRHATEKEEKVQKQGEKEQLTWEKKS